MKYFILIFLLLSLGLVYAEDFGAGETVQLYFSEGFSSGDVKLYYNFTDLVDINPIVKKIDEEYILYFDLPLNSSIGVYNVGNVTFNVVESSEVMRISPVYYIFSNDEGSFYVELESVKGSFEVLVNATNVEPRKSLVSLSEGETKKLYVDFKNVSEDGSLSLSYGNFSYEIKLVYFEDEVIVPEVVDEVIVPEVVDEVIEEKVPLTFLVTKPSVEVNLLYNESVIGTLKVQNTFDEELSGLSYKLNGNILNLVSFREEEVSLRAGEIYALDFVFNENENASVGVYDGEIIFGNTEHLISIPVMMNVSDVRVIEEEILYGNEIIYEGDIYEEESNNTLLYIGVALIALMVFLIIVVVLKLRQKQEKRFNEYIDETKKKK